MKLLSMFKPLQGIFKVSLRLHVNLVFKPEINYKILVHVFHQVEQQRDQALKALGDAKSGFENQMKQMVDRMTVLEQSHGELQAMRSNQRDLPSFQKPTWKRVRGVWGLQQPIQILSCLSWEVRRNDWSQRFKSKDEMIQSFRTQRESNAQIFPAPSTPPAKPGSWSNVASPSNALVVVNEADKWHGPGTKPCSTSWVAFKHREGRACCGWSCWKDFQFGNSSCSTCCSRPNGYAVIRQGW